MNKRSDLAKNKKDQTNFVLEPQCGDPWPRYDDKANKIKEIAARILDFAILHNNYCTIFRFYSTFKQTYTHTRALLIHMYLKVFRT